jgi:hypothetical protein
MVEIHNDWLSFGCASKKGRLSKAVTIETLSDANNSRTKCRPVAPDPPITTTFIEFFLQDRKIEVKHADNLIPVCITNFPNNFICFALYLP